MESDNGVIRRRARALVRRGSSRSLRPLGAAVLALLAASCATGGSTRAVTPDDIVVAVATFPSPTVAAAAEPTVVLPDVTARSLTAADLSAMLPGGDQALVANSDLITRSVSDTDDAAADVLGFHREVGVTTSMTTEFGIAHVWIDLLGDAESAHRYLVDTAGDIVKRVGGTHAPEVGATYAEEFPIAVGEESIGLLLELDGTATSETAVLFRLGRIVIYAGLEHPEGVDLRVALQYLAEDVQRQALATLAATPLPDGDPGTPTFRFETSLTVEAESGTWLIERFGQVSGQDVMCQVRTVGPDSEETVTVRQIDGAISVGIGSEALSGAGAGDLAVRGVIAGCSSWPLDAEAAGLDLLATTSTTRHRVNGVNALGYTPEPSALGPVLGARLDGVSVESFSFWIAEGTTWVVEVGFIASGDAAVLAPALPAAWSSLGTIRLVLRHRVFDIGAIDPSVLAVDPLMGTP